MKSSFLMIAAATAVLSFATAQADDKATTSPLPAPQEGVDTNAPLPGANSFTEAQVKERLEKNGFSQVSGLKLDEQGIWRGQAMQGDKPFQIAVDYRGNITYSGTIPGEGTKS
jgi:hypothetical protein